MTVGTMLGSGIYFKANVLALSLGRLDLIMVAWLAGGLLALCGALVYAELSAAMPRAGGAYVYVHRAFGPFFAYLLGWSSFIFSRAAATGALAVLAASLLGLEGWSRMLGAAILILVITGLHCTGVQTAGALQTGTTVIKVVGLLALSLAAGLANQGSESVGSVATELSWSAALLSVMWAYDGWYNVAAVAEEVDEPDRLLPRVLIGGVLCVTGLYLLANYAFYLAIPPAQMATMENPGVAVSRVALGPAGEIFFRILIAISVLGTLNAGLVCGPRIFYAMARDGLFFNYLGSLNDCQVPARASWLYAGWSSILVLIAAALPDRFGLFDRLTHWVILGVLVFSILTIASVYRLRSKEPEMERPYRCFGYPLTPLLFILISAALTLVTVAEQPRPALLGFLLVFTGLPFYRKLATKSSFSEGSGSKPGNS